MIVTCHTPGCGNAEQRIELLFPDVDGQQLVPDAVLCGPCGQPITDVVDEPLES